jgi:predicted HicB family RNase H-like nuclease
MKPLLRETLTLRLPTTLHRHLKAVAVYNGRSLNAEIVQRLLRSFEDRRPDLNRKERS